MLIWFNNRWMKKLATFRDFGSPLRAPALGGIQDSYSSIHARMSDDGDMRDENEVYYNLFEDAQKAIHDSEANQRRSQTVREELEAYIDSASERKGTDGQALIRIPSNFDTIVNSMNREDLSAEKSDEKPWSQYLFLDGLNADGDDEYNGRYNNAFRDTAEAKIKRGLAQIQLLDRQLQDATRKSSLESPRDNVGETFITNTRARKGPNLSRIVDSTRSSPNKTNQEKAPGIFDANKERDRKRLEWLLEADLTADSVVNEIGNYWDPVLDAERKDVDLKLAEFGHWGLLEIDEDLVEPLSIGQQVRRTTGRRPDYLDELRSAKMEKERLEHLDNQINACSSHPIEYAALLPTASSSNIKSNMSGRNYSTASTSAENARTRDMPIPDAGTVVPDKPVTFDDIQQLLLMLGHSQGQQPTEADGFSASHDAQKSPSCSKKMSGSVSPARSLQLHTVDKAGIKALVQQYKSDIEALGRVRGGQSLPVTATVDEKLLKSKNFTQAVHVNTGNDNNRHDKSIHDREENEHCLNISEEVPVAAINMAHPAVLVTKHRAGDHSYMVETVTRLPPVPPSVLIGDAEDRAHGSLSKHQPTLTVERDEGEAAMSLDSSFNALHQSFARKSELDREPPVRSPKTLRLPTSVLNAQLPNSQSINLTIFKAVNTRMEIDAAAVLNGKIANGARLAKRIGATLAGTSTANHIHRHSSQLPSASDEQPPVSPHSARRAQRAQNVLSSMSNSSKTKSDSMRI